MSEQQILEDWKKESIALRKRSDTWTERAKAYHRWRKYMELPFFIKWFRDKPPFVGTVSELSLWQKIGEYPPPHDKLGPEPKRYSHWGDARFAVGP